MGFQWLPPSQMGFNPCFSGSCSRISQGVMRLGRLESFNPCFSGSCSRISERFQRVNDGYNVSILVLVDLAHESGSTLDRATEIASFNPCFSGSCSRIWKNGNWYTHFSSFNPCFSGSCSRISLRRSLLPCGTTVSILVLVDLAHESHTAQ